MTKTSKNCAANHQIRRPSESGDWSTNHQILYSAQGSVHIYIYIILYYGHTPPLLFIRFLHNARILKLFEPGEPKQILTANSPPTTVKTYMKTFYNARVVVVLWPPSSPSLEHPGADSGGPSPSAGSLRPLETSAAQAITSFTASAIAHRTFGNDGNLGNPC